uniref:Uncharacterized protein n=1 Tax=Rhizophora mucronata TaxID=61149 RepID=A0A2P2P2R8_RHIMU
MEFEVVKECESTVQEKALS